MSVSVPIVFYSFVEDAVSRAVVIRLFDSIKRERLGVEIKFALGHPVVTNGCGDLKKRAKRFLAAAHSASLSRSLRRISEVLKELSLSSC